MVDQAIIDAMRKCRPLLEAEGVTGLFLYGSRARGDHRADSDVDVFIDHDETARFSLFNLAGIKLAIEQQLGLEAHVTTRGSLFPAVRSEIEQNAIKVF